MSGGNVTKIDKDYLHGLQRQLQDVLNNVETQLQGVGWEDGIPVNAVTQNLNVQAGSKSFDLASELNSVLNTLGGSVNSAMTGLRNLLNDTINEINTTANSFSSTDSLNAESVDQLIQDFQGAINDMNNLSSSASKSNNGTGNSSPNSGTGNSSPGG